MLTSPPIGGWAAQGEGVSEGGSFRRGPCGSHPTCRLLPEAPVRLSPMTQPVIGLLPVAATRSHRTTFNPGDQCRPGQRGGVAPWFPAVPAPFRLPATRACTSASFCPCFLF